MSKWSGLKFKIAQELGECMDCTYLKYDTESNRGNFYIYPHETHDGVSAFTDLLPRHGIQLNSQPKLRDGSNRPSFWQKLRSLINYIKLTSSVKTSWKKKKVDMTGVSEGFSFSYFNEEQTTLIKNYCKGHKLSLTVFLLSSLDAVVNQKLLVPGSVRKWISPINMRGGVSNGDVQGNYSASIILNADDSFDEDRWQKDFVSYLKKRIHWGAWIYTNMARFIGEAGTKFMAKRLKDLAVGVISNMGEWPNQDCQDGIQGKGTFIIIPVIPASQLTPIGAACSVWYGRLGLTLRVHPSLQLQHDEILSIHEAWLNEINRRVGTNANEFEFYTRAQEYAQEVYQ